MSKTITFDWAGGKYTQKIKVNGNNLPWGFKCGEDWIKVQQSMTALDITVDKVYDFLDRSGLVTIYDSGGHTLELKVEQTGYRDLCIECAPNIVIYEDVYEDGKPFDMYITVYGGQTQKVVCKEIEQYLELVWDNSDSYNDFMFHIPQQVSGKFTVRHSDADAFIAYCKKYGIPYDESKLEKTITVTQLTKADKIGEILLEYDGKVYSMHDNMEVVVDKNIWTELKVLTTKYVKILSNVEYEIIDNQQLNPSLMAQWLTVDAKKGLVKLKASSTNPFTDRYCRLRLTNAANSLQYIDIRILQHGVASQVD